MSHQLSLKFAVREYLSTHDEPPSYPGEIAGDRVDGEEAQAALEQALAPELKGHRKKSHRLYAALKARLDPKGQELLSQLWDAQAGCMVAYEDLAWHISAEVERQKTRRKLKVLKGLKSGHKW